MQPITFVLLYGAGVLLSIALFQVVVNNHRDYIENELHMSREHWMSRAIIISILFWEVVLVCAFVGVLIDMVKQEE